MKKRMLLYVVLGLVFYLLFLIIQIPASWFAWGLNQYSHGAVRLDPLGGSLWSGNGRLVIYYPQTVPHDFGQTEWSINPGWLFTGRVQMHWRTESPDRRIDTVLRFGGNQTQLLETQAALPASAVSAFYPPASLISPQGQVSLRTGKLVIGGGLTGNAEIQWQNASSALSSVQPLGTYRLEVSGAGETATLRLTTMQGVLELSGQGQWQAKTGQVQLTGSAVPRERAAELEPLLKLMGNDQGAGRRALAFNFPLTPAIRPTPTLPTPTANPPVKPK